MHNFFLHKNILIFRRFFNSANRLYKIYATHTFHTYSLHPLFRSILYLTSANTPRNDNGEHRRKELCLYLKNVVILRQMPFLTHLAQNND